MKLLPVFADLCGIAKIINIEKVLQKQNLFCCIFFWHFYLLRFVVSLHNPHEAQQIGAYRYAVSESQPWRTLWLPVVTITLQRFSICVNIKRYAFPFCHNNLLSQQIMYLVFGNIDKN